MKKIIKLKESDIEMIVKKVLSEQGNMFGTAGLGMDSALSSKKTDTPKQKVDINPKKLKVGDGGKFKPKQIADVKALQQKLMDLKLLKTDTMVPTGYFGSLTQKALDAYNAGSQAVAAGDTKGVKKDVPTKGKPSKGGFILIFAFPTYKPSLEKGDKFSEGYAKVVKFFSGKKPEKFPPMGHGGCVVIDSLGNSTLYEFGRYAGHKTGYGLVEHENLGKIAKINNGVLENAEQVAKIAKSKTQGEGPKLGMQVVTFKLPNPAGAIQYASVKERKYEILDMDADDEESNCGTFTLKVAQAGGVDVPEYCFPAPAAMVQQLRLSADDFFEV
jgi:hypothetical protein